MKRTAARLVRHALEQIGVRYTFGIPGVHNLELYDELGKSETIEPVLVTHEMCAAFMADAISRSTETLGTLVVVPAAGITHASSGIGEAYLDGIPMLVISGGIRTDLDQRYQLHDIDQQALLAPITKAVHRVEDYESLIPTLYSAYETAVSGEPGPVYIELPANLQLFPGEVSSVPDYHRPRRHADTEDTALDRAARALVQASSPGIFVGWGARHAVDAITRIAERLAAPVATTLQGLATFPGNHALHVGMGFGRSSVPAAENAFANCDAMLAVGTRFAEICTGSYGSVPPGELVHIDINPAALGANFPASVPIAGDAAVLLPALAERIDALLPEPRDCSALVARIAADKRAYHDEWLAHDSGDRVNPARFFGALRAQLADDAVVVADDGNHTFLTAELMPIHRGGEYLSPTDFNCMGYCVPATIAVALAHPGRQVVGIVGDGAFLMSGMEIATAVARNIGCMFFVFNDGELSQISQAQQIPYNRKVCTVLHPLDYQAFARAVGARFVSISNDAGVEGGIWAALEHARQGEAVLVDVRIDYSKRTRFTQGTVKTNLDRFDNKTKLRFVGRALWRKLTG